MYYRRGLGQWEDTADGVVSDGGGTGGGGFFDTTLSDLIASGSRLTTDILKLRPGSNVIRMVGPHGEQFYSGPAYTEAAPPYFGGVGTGFPWGTVLLVGGGPLLVSTVGRER